MATTPNNSHILPFVVQQKGLWVVRKSDPNVTDPVQYKKLQALVGANNIVVLDDADYLRYLGGTELIDLFSSENVDPFSQNNPVDPTVPPPPKAIGKIVLPPPIDLSVKGTHIEKDGTATVTLQFTGLKQYKSSYKASILSVVQYPQYTVEGIVVTPAKPDATVLWNTTSDANNYLVKAIDSVHNTFLPAVVTASQSVPTQTYVFRNLPSGRYYISVTPYNDYGVNGIESFSLNSDGTKEVINLV